MLRNITKQLENFQLLEIKEKRLIATLAQDFDGSKAFSTTHHESSVSSIALN